jgi:hypothetical protein
MLFFYTSYSLTVVCRTLTRVFHLHIHYPMKNISVVSLYCYVTIVLVNFLKQLNISSLWAKHNNLLALFLLADG